MSGDREAYQTAMREAHAFAGSLKWESATQRYREALGEFPNDPTARLSLAVALTRIGDTEGALKEYLQARVLLPGDPIVLGRIGDLYARSGKGPEAAKAFVEQSRLFLSQGDSERATASLRRAADAAGHDPRSLALIAEAARGVSSPAVKALLAEVEAIIAQTPAIVDGATADDVAPQASAEPERDDDEATVAAITARGVESEQHQPLVNDDPSQLIQAAEHAAESGRIIPAILNYLRAADLLSGSSAGSEALLSAERLVGDWLPGELSEIADLPAACRGLVLEAMEASGCYLRSGFLTAAADEAFRSVGGAPTYLPAQIRLADVERNAGRIADAVARVGTVATLYGLRGEQPRAVAALRLQVEMDADPEAARRRLVDFMIATSQTSKAAAELVTWAHEALAAGQLETAADRLREGAALVASTDALVPLGETLEALGHTEKARDAFDQALSLVSGDVGALAGAVRCAAALEDWPGMESRLDVLGGLLRTNSAPNADVLSGFRTALIRYGERPGLVYCLGILLLLSGGDAEGEAYLQQAAAIDSRPGRLACYHLGERDALADRYAEAARWLWRIGEPAEAESDADRELSIAGYRRLVELSGRAGDWDGAARGIEGLLRVFSEEDALHARLAEVYFRLRKVGDAVRVLGELASVYASRGEIERAIGVERGRVQIAPKDGAIRARLGRLLVGINRIDEGLVELDSAVKLLSADGRAADAVEIARLMLDLCRHRDPRRALALRETIAALAPDDADARFDLIDAYIKLGRSVRAESEARQLVDLLLGQYRLPEAARALRIVIQLAPWNLDDRVRLGRALGQIGEIDEALATLQGVLSRDPANREASASLSSLLALAAAQARDVTRTKD